MPVPSAPRNNLDLPKMSQKALITRSIRLQNRIGRVQFGSRVAPGLIEVRPRRVGTGAGPHWHTCERGQRSGPTASSSPAFAFV